jgi:hypothetical protein
MWWIAACLGALLWLLVMRIKLKEKQRDQQLGEREAQVRVSQRAELVKQVFLPAARRYLAQHAEVDNLALLFALFEWPNRPSEVHVSVIPVLQNQMGWPELLAHSQWVQKVDDQWVFDAPESHWNSFAAVGQSPHVAAFAPLFTAVPDTTAFADAYQLYAVVRRPGGVQPELEVVGEPTV